MIVTNGPESVSNIESVRPIDAGFPTDHHLLEFDFNIYNRRVRNIGRTVYNFKAADIASIKNAIKNSDALLNSGNYVNVDECWSSWKNSLMDIIDTYVPKVKAKDPCTPPWIDADVIHLLNKKETARRSAKKLDSYINREKYRKLRKESKLLIDKKYKEYINSLGEAIKKNPKRFWSYFRSKTKSNSIPASIKFKNRSFLSANDKAEVFNQYFYSTFSQPDDVSYSFESPQFSEPKFNLLQLSEEEVYQVLSKLDSHKAPGVDGLPTFILKECSTELSPSLCCLFNLSLSSGRLPQEWKNSLVVPVYKKGKKEDVENYRPISLLCVTSKVLERCIFNHLIDHFGSIFVDCQHGFLKGRSTVTQLLSFLHEIGQSLDKGLQSDIVYLDFAKAFDSVCHKRLVFKLRLFGIGGELLNWFENYLQNRYQSCVVQGSTSSKLPVNSGVPQGSILGPLMFLVYINDLPAVVDSSIAMFADDSKCSRVIKNLDDCHVLQEDLDCLQGWADSWRLCFNTAKCEVLSVSRKRHPIVYDYKIGQHSLVHSASQKDLGIIITKDLKWNAHINNTLAKSYKMLGFLRRHSCNSFDLSTRRLLYLTIVRPYIGYASEVWAPQGIGNIVKVESLQHRATKYILNLNCQDDLGYRERLLKSDLLPISYWHEMKDLIFYFKCSIGFYNVSINDFVKTSQSTRSLRNSSSLDLFVPKCRTKLFQTSYYNRIPKLWNNLPCYTRSVESVNQFKSRLFNRYSIALSNYYEAENKVTWKSICPKCCTSRNIISSKICCY